MTWKILIIMQLISHKSFMNTKSDICKWSFQTNRTSIGFCWFQTNRTSIGFCWFQTNRTSIGFYWSQTSILYWFLTNRTSIGFCWFKTNKNLYWFLLVSANRTSIGFRPIEPLLVSVGMKTYHWVSVGVTCIGPVGCVGFYACCWILLVSMWSLLVSVGLVGIWWLQY